MKKKTNSYDSRVTNCKTLIYFLYKDIDDIYLY